MMGLWTARVVPASSRNAGQSTVRRQAAETAARSPQPFLPASVVALLARAVCAENTFASVLKVLSTFSGRPARGRGHQVDAGAPVIQAPRDRAAQFENPVQTAPQKANSQARAVADQPGRRNESGVEAAAGNRKVVRAEPTFHRVREHDLHQLA